MSDAPAPPPDASAPHLIPGPYLVFETDADARNAIRLISRAMGLGRGATTIYTVPIALEDGRSAVLKPGDDAFLADVGGYVEAAEIVPADAGVNGPELFVPTSVSRAQARAVMLMETRGESTLFDLVDGILRAGRNGTLQQRIAWQAWESSNNVTRTGELVTALAASPAIGLTEEDLDRLFREAAKIQF